MCCRNTDASGLCKPASLSCLVIPIYTSWGHSELLIIQSAPSPTTLRRLSCWVWFLSPRAWPCCKLLFGPLEAGTHWCPTYLLLQSSFTILARSPVGAPVYNIVIYSSSSNGYSCSWRLLNTVPLQTPSALILVSNLVSLSYQHSLLASGLKTSSPQQSKARKTVC